MILSISRRTDIPAYYSPWILSRLEAGEVWIRNPRSPRQVSRVLFSPETVDCLVFWSKNPGPMLPYLSRLSSLGYPFYFQHTLTPYGKDIEPGLPPKRQILSFIQAFGKQLGPQRTVWRYDPVLLNQTWTIERHIQAFSQLCPGFGRLRLSVRVLFFRPLSLFIQTHWGAPPPYPRTAAENRSSFRPVRRRSWHRFDSLCRRRGFFFLWR